MNVAVWPRDNPLAERLLVIDPRAASHRDATVADLPSLLSPGDVLMVNDAATLPASLMGHTEPGQKVELRLAARRGDTWTCVVFGEGDWRTRTEDRPPPPSLRVGETIRFDASFHACVTRVCSARLVEAQLVSKGASIWSALYRAGRPIQYSYVRGPLPLWAVQTGYASRPWAMEMPSAGRPLSASLFAALHARGVRVFPLTHAAGLSSTGDAALDEALPFPEASDLPERTVRAILEARASGGRVVAVGTSVVRALEGRVAARAELVAGEAVTDLRISPAHRLRVVDGLLTGMHEPTASHYELLGAFVSAELLARAYRHATAAGYLCHEFGDSTLILSSP